MKIKMFQTKQKNLAEVCPQCCKLIDSSAYRLVQDTCGHMKCRICLLQETTGCLLCNTEKLSNTCKEERGNQNNNYAIESCEHQQRKSVITSLAIQIAEQNECDGGKNNLLSPPSVDKDTCHLIKQSFEKDILFPTDIVKRSTGNFYHLKRVFSQRFFNEDGNIKKNKACETDKNWSVLKNRVDQGENKNIAAERSWKLPDHIQLQYYCTVHKITLDEKSVKKSHMTCSCDSEKATSSLFKCKICNKDYRLISKLNRHMKVHTKNTNFRCEQCGKACADNYALKTHERTHTNKKPYMCSYCDKKFSGLQNFKRHEMKHRNEKKFTCNECGFKFITSSELKRHSITHTNIKPFICQICFHKFSFKRTLLRHMKTHDANLVKLKCTHCESTFKRKDNLERHIKSAHPKTNDDLINC